MTTTQQPRRFISGAVQRQLLEEAAAAERERLREQEAIERISKPIPAALINQFTVVSDKNGETTSSDDPETTFHPAVLTIAGIAMIIVLVIAGYMLISFINTPPTTRITSERPLPTVGASVASEPAAVATAAPIEMSPDMVQVYHAPNESLAAKPIARAEQLVADGRCGTDGRWVHLSRKNGQPAVWALVSDLGVDPKMVAVLRNLCPTNTAPAAPVVMATSVVAPTVAPEIVTAPAGVTSIREEFGMHVPASTCTYETAPYRATVEVLRQGGGAMAGTPIGTVEGFSCQSMDEARAMAQQRANERARVVANP